MHFLLQFKLYMDATQKQVSFAIGLIRLREITPKRFVSVF
jgi:hypothetical protein